MEDFILKAEKIDKHFGGIKALDKVDFQLRRGTVHAVMGENGAGKSTLMKILLGYHRPDSGDIYIGGSKVNLRGTSDALDAGISMIYQELNPVPHMTVADNIFLGREPLTKAGLVDYRKMHQETEALFEKIGIDIDPQVLVRELTVAKIQLVEIAKAVSYKSEILVMDEPTSALSRREIEHLFDVVKSLNRKGVSIVYISHKLDEVYEICEDVTILRDGRLIKTGKLSEIAEEELVSMMVGQEVKEMFPWKETEKGEVVLEVRGLTRASEFENISFSLRRGEILGIAGLVGAGRTEVAETIYGMRQPDEGSILINNKEVKINHPGDALKSRVVLVSEDRKNHGLVLMLSIAKNIVLPSLRKCMGRFLLDPKKEAKDVSEVMTKLQIKAAGMDQKVSSLSGGNQQKVVVAKIMYADPEIIILDEPTRGIDVKTKSEIHLLMSNLADEGKAVLMISSELPEVMGMSDRIIVMSQGRIAGELTREEASQEKILTMAMKNAG